MIRIAVLSGALRARATGVGPAAIFNTARSATGFPYFWAVDRGRRPVVPVRARVLRFMGRDGRIIFARRVGPAEPQNLTLQTLQRLEEHARLAAIGAPGGTLHDWILGFLNSLAGLQAEELSRLSPTGLTGRLARSYQVQPAR
jgi:hypothetical protein